MSMRSGADGAPADHTQEDAMFNPAEDAIITIAEFGGEEFCVIDAEAGIAQDVATGGLHQINWDAVSWADTGRTAE